ncbi:hypothetical protein [Abyssicoccus albus]|uniref:hypothetical protein n=1 Tax=Abyssicoccus albus TaxID=1817405 RepID=UPI00097E29B5|nr:hypothetical protein [Abyssicoccus albus]AQL56245.1 hypothetical protein BVH56_04610 [Abyssicoccus albus]
MNKKYNDYKNPFRLLWDFRSELLPKYIVVLWLIIGVILVILSGFKLINLSSLDIKEYVSISVSGLNFALIITSAALAVYNKDELTLLLELDFSKHKSRVPGAYFLEILAPYALTLILFLILGLSSVILPLITLTPPLIIRIIVNIIYIEIIILGILSLFNLAYTILIELYYKVQRDSNRR